MKKQLPTNTIANELSGASVFFQPSSPLPRQPTAAIPQETPNHSPTHPIATTPMPESKERVAMLIVDKTDQPPVPYEASQSGHHDTMPPRYHATKHTARHAALPSTKIDDGQANALPRHHDTVIPSLIETVRKAVKQLGKEAATHRFTTEEKRALAEIVYTYARRGCKTSENEISRIAINWLVQDYQQHGAASILDQVLKALNE